jgi:hypothetical protein
MDHSLDGQWQAQYRARIRSVTGDEPGYIDSYRALASTAVHRTRQSFRSLRPRKRNESQLPASKPRATAPGPRRPLTPPLPADTTTQETGDQWQSPFFKLPLELRQEIYKQVLGDSNVHITRAVTLHHLRCKCVSCPGYASYFDYGTAWKRTWVCDGSKYDYDGDRLSIALLGTCRRVYAEAVNVLYSSNTFTFQNAEVLRGFLGLLSPGSRSSLATVHMDVCPDAPMRSSSDLFHQIGACNVFVELPGLRSLELRIHLSPMSRWTGNLAAFDPLAQLKGNRNLRQARFYLPGQSKGLAWMHERPFEVLPLDAWPWLRRRDLPRDVFV